MYENKCMMYEPQYVDYQFFAKNEIPVYLSIPT
jgi:hypothetical protein